MSNYALAVYRIECYAGDTSHNLVDVFYGRNVPDEYLASEYVIKVVQIVDYTDTEGLEDNVRKIKRGLACCTEADCHNCPYAEFCDGNCYDNLKKDALAIITVLQERTERLAVENARHKVQITQSLAK